MCDVEAQIEYSQGTSDKQDEWTSHIEHRNRNVECRCPRRMGVVVILP